jgi:hypothetical protein
MSELIAVLDLQDLRGLRIQCTGCGASVLVSGGNGWTIPRACPTSGCRVRWDSFGQENIVNNAQQLLNLLSFWSTYPAEKKPFEIRFEVSPSALR